MHFTLPRDTDQLTSMAFRLIFAAFFVASASAFVQQCPLAEWPECGNDEFSCWKGFDPATGCDLGGAKSS